MCRYSLLCWAPSYTTPITVSSGYNRQYRRFYMLVGTGKISPKKIQVTYDTIMCFAVSTFAYFNRFPMLCLYHCSKTIIPVTILIGRLTMHCVSLEISPKSSKTVWIWNTLLRGAQVLSLTRQYAITVWSASAWVLMLQIVFERETLAWFTRRKSCSPRSFHHIACNRPPPWMRRKNTTISLDSVQCLL